MEVMKTVCAALAMGMAVLAGAGERYSYVREFKVDGRDVRLGAGETKLDLTKIYPDAWKPGVAGSRWADVEVDFTKAAGKICPLFHSSGFGPLICSCPHSTIDVRVEGNRLVLPKRGRDSASYLVTWER